MCRGFIDVNYYNINTFVYNEMILPYKLIVAIIALVWLFVSSKLCFQFASVIGGSVSVSVEAIVFMNQSFGRFMTSTLIRFHQPNNLISSAY